jgi:hypothetical protein
MSIAAILNAVDDERAKQVAELGRLRRLAARKLCSSDLRAARAELSRAAKEIDSAPADRRHVPAAMLARVAERFELDAAK